MENLKEAFLNYINKVPFYGLAVLCLDHPTIRSILPEVRKRNLTYGFSRQADFRAEDVRFEGWQSRFNVFMQEEFLGEICLKMPGLHNVANALAAIVVARELELDFPVIKSGLEHFQGIQRRLQIKGEGRGITIVDDYAHHPEEIRATLQAVRKSWEKGICAVFQPHRYSRTNLCFDDFLGAFHDVDMVIVTDIYAAGEKAIEGVSAADLVEGIRRQGHKEVHHIPDFADICTFLEERCCRGDMVITLGAGDVYRI